MVVNPNSTKIPKMRLVSQHDPLLFTTLQLLAAIEEVVPTLEASLASSESNQSQKLLTLSIRPVEVGGADFYTSYVVVLSSQTWPQLEFTTTKELQICIRGNLVPHFVGIQDKAGLANILKEFYGPYWNRDFSVKA